MKSFFRSGRFLLCVALLSIFGASVFTACQKNKDEAVVTAEENFPNPELARAEVPLHTTCRECHADIFEKWSGSHHALANRELHPAIDDQVFAGAAPVVEENQTTAFRKNGDNYEYVITLPDGEEKIFTADMVLGHYPLFQYLMPIGNGRWQATDLAFDPDKKEFFSVTPDEERDWDDWLHWTKRSMNWNSNCAQCHMTHYHKNYDADSDSYSSTWHEQGITCLQCHDNMAEHIKNPNVPLTELVGEKYIQSCAGCHSRRTELTEDFSPGDSYHDHYRLQLPTVPNLYYPDGQIRDEVFVHGSFIMSKMGHAGVTCKNCHDPHSNELILPAENNMLCLQCHGNGQLGAKIIEPLAHSFHAEGSTGNQCINCHMTETTYMARDPRKDHGFHIPDPQLTKELGIPNACNKCHQDQSTEWAIEWTEKWYGEKMERPERDRSRVVAQVYEGILRDYRPLLAQYDKQEIVPWRATLLGLLSNWAGVPEVDERALEALQSKEPLLRSQAIQLLQYNPAHMEVIRRHLEDDSRLVRLDAAWALRHQLAPDHPAVKELLASLELRQDQPGGAAMLAEWYQARQDYPQAQKLFEKAVRWDDREPGYHYQLAIIYNQRNLHDKARQSFQEAMKLMPDNAFLVYQYALFENERGNAREARNALLKAVGIDPRYSRAWYNLALMYAQAGQQQSADNAIDRAMQLEPSNIDFAYAKATILAQMNKTQQAIELLQMIIVQDQQYQPAMQLLNQLMRQQRAGQGATP